MRNKKSFKYALALAILMPFLTVSLVSAELGEEETEPEMKDVKNQRELKSENSTLKKTEDRKLQSTENKSEVLAKRVDSIKKLMQVQTNRSQKVLDKMDEIIQRIESNREKLSDEGVNLTSVDALIAKAKTQRTVAKTALDKAKSDLEALTATSENQKRQVQTFMASMKDLKKQLNTLHRTLKEVVKEMKKGALKPKREQEVTPTPTPTTPTTPPPAPSPSPSSN